MVDTAAQRICRACHTEFKPKKKNPIAGWVVMGIGCVFALFGLLAAAIGGSPGALVVSVVGCFAIVIGIKNAQRSSDCLACGSKDTIPLDTPAGKALRKTVTSALLIFLTAFTFGQEIDTTLKRFPEIAEAKKRELQAQEDYENAVLKIWEGINKSKAIVPDLPKDPKASEEARANAAQRWNMRVDFYIELFNVKGHPGNQLTEILATFIHERDEYVKSFPNDGERLGPLMLTDESATPAKKKGTIKAKLADGSTVEQ